MLNWRPLPLMELAPLTTFLVCMWLDQQLPKSVATTLANIFTLMLEHTKTLKHHCPRCWLGPVTVDSGESWSVTSSAAPWHCHHLDVSNTTQAHMAASSHSTMTPVDHIFTLHLKTTIFVWGERRDIAVLATAWPQTRTLSRLPDHPPATTAMLVTLLRIRRML